MAILQKFPEKLITGEELLRLPDLGPCELVNGRIVPMPLTGDEHGDIVAELAMRLRSYGKESRRGRAVSGDVGVYTHRDPDTVRAPDLLFISKERDLHPRAKGFFQVAPELVVEVMSPTDSWRKVREKLQEYFFAGVLRVWVVVPKSRRVLVYRSPESFVEVGVGEILQDEELLPGFSLTIADLFSL